MASKEYELTSEQMKRLLEASKPVPLMYLSGGESMFRSPQETANAFWQELGRELKFDWRTVRPVSGKDTKFFMAVSTEGE